MRITLFTLALCALPLLGSACVLQTPGPVGPGASASGLEYGTNRYGGDYRGLDVASARPEECRDACFSDPSCAAFSFVNPGIQGPMARCWLKNRVPRPTADNCCVSGVKGFVTTSAPPSGVGAAPPVAVVAMPSAAPLEANSNRYGGDYRGFHPAQPNPELCRQACLAESPCRSFAYVRPGVQGPAPRCWLKSTVPPRTADSCCTSGVK